MVLFHLPNKTCLHESKSNFELIVVDLSEHLIDPPPQKSEKTTQAKRSDTL